MINKTQFDRVFLQAVNELRKLAPKDTGNLAYNSIKYRWINDHQFEIYVDVGNTSAFVLGEKFDKGVAPYMPFTNEEWISPKWNGKQNPNQDWWNKAIEYIIGFIAKRFGSAVYRGLTEKEIKEIGEF